MRPTITKPFVAMPMFDQKRDDKHWDDECLTLLCSFAPDSVKQLCTLGKKLSVKMLREYCKAVGLYVPAITLRADLRRDPRRNATTTVHLAGNYGNTEQDTGRPTAGQRSFHLGPGERVLGGQLTFAYPERFTGKPVQYREPDTSEMLYQFRLGLEAAHGAAGARAELADTLPGVAASTPAAPPARSHEAGLHTDAAAAGSSLHGSLRQALAGPRAQTAPSGSSRERMRQQQSLAHQQGRKTLYWDGRAHHVADIAHSASDLRARSPVKSVTDWSKKQLVHRDLEPGPFLGAVETPAAQGVHLVGGKHRLMPAYAPSGLSKEEGLVPRRSTVAVAAKPGEQSEEAPPIESLPTGVRGAAPTSNIAETGGVWRTGSVAPRSNTLGMSAESVARHTLADRAATQSHLASSMHVGKPNLLLTPSAHETTRLSLRRPMTSAGRCGWQVKAAVWVKKMRVDRGTVHVARAVGPGHYQVDDSLRPRYVVPDLVNTQLKPYVTPYARDSLPSIVNESKSSS
ncbi:hypothetical protein QJQ45_010892 [Haematococcus lacustris]|nr:hypothetical protein QJQ45_010892 [Haematococcus lacustris]